MTHPETLLLGLPGNRARELAAEIHALRTALYSVTDDATPDQIHGRIDSLIQERREELRGLCAAALAEAQPET